MLRFKGGLWRGGLLLLLAAGILAGPGLAQAQSGDDVLPSNLRVREAAPALQPTVAATATQSFSLTMPASDQELRRGFRGIGSLGNLPGWAWLIISTIVIIAVCYRIYKWVNEAK